MSSSIDITFQVQDLSAGGFNNGIVDLIYNDGIHSYGLTEALVPQRSKQLQFTEVVGTGAISENNQQAQNYVAAFLADHAQTGTNNVFSASRVDNVVTITASQGTFASLQYSGNKLIINSNIDNGTAQTSKVFSLTKDGTGDCNTLDYTIAASGGVSPYRVDLNGNTSLSGWDGTSQTIQLGRSMLLNVQVFDSNNNQIGADKQVVVPRKYNVNDFSINVAKFTTHGDITITVDTPIADTTPLEYSLDGTNYQQSNVFPTILEGEYILSIRDKYGCEFTTTVVVDVADVEEIEQKRLLEVSNLNSIPFRKVRKEGGKRNYFNSQSYEEIASVTHEVVVNFPVGRLVPVQFKSAYSYNGATFHEDGNKLPLLPFKLTENMGFTEKVDCVIFPIGTKTGIFFDGGNSYATNSTTITGSSPHALFLPDWGDIGQTVSIDGKGTFTVNQIGFNEILDRWYLEIDLTIGAQEVGKIQATYNIQDYEVYECFLDMSLVQKGGFIIIESGYAFNKIDQKEKSYYINKIVDDCSYLKLEWFHSLNIGGLVFQSGTKHFGYFKGLFQAGITSESDTVQGDDRAYSLYQDTGIKYVLTIAGLNTQMQSKLSMAAALDGFKVNEVLVIKDKAKFDRYGFTNLGTLELELLGSGDNLDIQDDEIILNPSTGIIGGEKPLPTINYDGKTRLINSDGAFIATDGDFIDVTDV